MKTVCFAILTFAVTSGMAQQAPTTNDITGTWLVQDGSARIAITEKNGTYQGKIIWLEEPADAMGKPVLDSKNPDLSKRGRPQMGLLLLTGFTRESKDLWTGGEIYDPDSGNTYSCKITLRGATTMDVRGYVGISLFGRTETWKRVTPDHLGSAH